MKFVPMLELMKKARAGGYAVPAFACWSAESLSVVLRTAQEMSSPVIIMGAWVDLDEISPEEYGRVAYAVAEGYSELITTYRESVMRQWTNKQNLWIPTACGQAAREMSEVLRKWIRILNSEDKA